ncbi:interleukin-10 [Triplophysa dalaica]|uniref:interleukin-10 n=1 Tax=Triplophysa dalaica TaxID=1582913 RepID=UPI0024DF764B|nr:interleukin-10 [Triplophysa dalaica]
MNFSGVIFSAVVLILLSDNATCKRDCKSECCSFVEGFPSRLKELRSSYKQIFKLYESNDDLEALLDNNMQKNINGPHGCHVVNDILHFYLETVLPTAMKDNNAGIKSPINSIGNIFKSLQRDMVKCRIYLSCHKVFDITSIKDSYEKMEDKGNNKAMGELDLLFKYIEQYVASKRGRH